MIVQMQTRPSTSLRFLCDVAASHGVSAEECLADTAVSVSDLDDVNATHSTADEIRAIENLVRHLPDAVGVGFEVGRAMHVHAFGIWGFAILTSPTLRAAIETAINYAKLSFIIAEMSLIEDNVEARLEFDTSGLPVATHRFIVERHAVIAVKFIRDLLQCQDLHGFEMRLMDTDPDYPGQIAEFTPLPVVMGQPANALTFSADLLDRPLPKSDPVSLQFCLDQCKALLEKQDGVLSGWSQQVRDAIVDNIGKEQQIEDVAAELAVTGRTLRRRLTEEGTNFRQLYLDARMAIAHELLVSAGLNVETVAWRVGYAEPASFARAFTKKYGRTPGQARKESAATLS
jgi:AraC-like DNA-binding protein